MTKKVPPSQLLYKGMLENGLTRYQRPGWGLPTGRRPGLWMPKVTPKLCISGYHACTLEQLPEWIAPAIYVVEVRGENVADHNKSAWEQARLVRRIDGWGMAEMVEWAKKCAAHIGSAAYAADAATYAAAARVAAARVATYAADTYAADAATYATYAASAARAAAAVAYAASRAADAAEQAWQVNLLREMLGV